MATFFKKTYKSGGVVIPCRFGISESLENWIGLDNLVFKRGLFGRLLLLFSGTNHGKVGHHFLGVLSFASTRFSAVINAILNIKIYKHDYSKAKLQQNSRFELTKGAFINDVPQLGGWEMTYL